METSQCSQTIVIPTGTNTKTTIPTILLFPPGMKRRCVYKYWFSCRGGVKCSMIIHFVTRVSFRNRDRFSKSIGKLILRCVTHRYTHSLINPMLGMGWGVFISRKWFTRWWSYRAKLLCQCAWQINFWVSPKTSPFIETNIFKGWDSLSTTSKI